MVPDSRGKEKAAYSKGGNLGKVTSYMSSKNIEFSWRVQKLIESPGLSVVFGLIRQA